MQLLWLNTTAQASSMILSTLLWSVIQRDTIRTYVTVVRCFYMHMYCILDPNYINYMTVQYV